MVQEGDAAEYQNKLLKILSRQKDQFKTSSGKFIDPVEIENFLKRSEYVRHALVYGENRNFLICLIVPDFERLKNSDLVTSGPENDNSAIIKNKVVIEKFSELIEKYNFESNAIGAERIEKFLVLADEWSEKSGELTSTFKLKRQEIINKYNKEISLFYNDSQNRRI